MAHAAKTTTVRVLYAWEGGGRPHEPNAIVEMERSEAEARIADGHAEAVPQESPEPRPERPRRPGRTAREAPEQAVEAPPETR